MIKTNQMANQTLSLKKLINPTPKQEEAIKLIQKYKYFLYGGAMGGGKSYLLRWALVILLIWYWKTFKVKIVRVGLFCEDYPSLQDRHESKMQFEFPEWLGVLNRQRHEYILRPEYGGGVIALRNLDDPSKYASAEFAAIAVDELTKNPVETFNFLRTRLRWAGIPEWAWKFLAGTNPGSRGHAWVKKKWMDREFDANEVEADQFMYLKALASDNEHIDKGYMKSLDSLPEKLRKAYKEGDWDIFAGQYFDEWRREHNVCDPHPVPEFWMHFISVDYGYDHPSAVYWGALDTIGRVVIFRELYENGYTYSKLAKKIMSMTPKEERELYNGNMVADPAIFAKKGENDEEKSGAEIMEDATGGWLNFRRANNDRIIGWGIMREYMKAFTFENQITSKLIFFSTCTNAIRTIPALVHSETRPEDVEKGSDDDAGDSIRYMLMDIYELQSEKPREIKPVRTTDDIFEADMKSLREEREDQREDTRWMEM
jgi:phage terminase large subunit